MYSDRSGNSPDSIVSTNSSKSMVPVGGGGGSTSGGGFTAGSFSTVLKPTTSSSPSAASEASQLSTLALAKREKIHTQRRKHKNSKLGCGNCKKRRVKCSEDLPSCLNCVKHKVNCNYLAYTPEQLDELRQAKLARLEDSYDANNSRGSIDDTTSAAHHRRKPKFPSISKEELNQSSSFNNTVSLDNQRSIVQDFDNLLSSAKTEDRMTEIIYPVYSIHQANRDPFGHLVQPQPYIRQQRVRRPASTVPESPEWASLDVDGFSDQLHSFTADPLDPQFPTLFQRVRNEQTRSSLAGLENLDALAINKSFRQAAPYKGLPESIRRASTFKVKSSRSHINYNVEMTKALIKLSQQVSAGAATLPSIRVLYHVWINSLIYNASTSGLLFSTLINLTTNYVISNYFNNCAGYRKPAHYHESGSGMSNLEMTRLKNILILKSIRHYDVVIKGLRYSLNQNKYPEMCASASYLLLLMSVYDPEVTVDSTMCFRDGLFGVLTYNLGESVRNKQPPPPIISVHLRLMKNIVRSVYLPAYDPAFLREYHYLLRRFGTILKPSLQQAFEAIDASETPSYAARDKLAFLELKYDDLAGFVNDTVTKYIPEINSSLHDIKKQKEKLFDMVYTWVRLLPSRLLIITPTMSPLLKVLYLFYKLLNKALFAIFPQIKLFFLRDFDSPLMSDVFQESINLHKCILSDDVIQQSDDLRRICNYAIRIVIFFETRLSVLYGILVYDERFTKELAIDDIRLWIKNVTDIEKTRREFIRITRVKEVQIRRFLTTTIEKKHYPVIGEGEVPSPVPAVSAASAEAAADYEEIQEDESEESDEEMYDEDYDLASALNSGRLAPSGLFESDFKLM